MNHEKLLLDQLKDSIKSEVKKYLSTLSRDELSELSIFFGEEQRELNDMSLRVINEASDLKPVSFDEGLSDNDIAELNEDINSSFIEAMKYIDQDKSNSIRKIKAEGDKMLKDYHDKVMKEHNVKS